MKSKVFSIDRDQEVFPFIGCDEENVFIVHKFNNPYKQNYDVTVLDSKVFTIGAYEENFIAANEVKKFLGAVELEQE